MLTVNLSLQPEAGPLTKKVSLTETAKQIKFFMFFFDFLQCEGRFGGSINVELQVCYHDCISIETGASKLARFRLQCTIQRDLQ
jgi:hypothetical protein